MRLRLLDGFLLSQQNRELDVGRTQQRLLAYVALCGPTARDKIAAELWPDAGADRAMGRLRTALWRLNQLGLPLLIADGETLALSPAVHVDLAVTDRARELLPGWYEDWVLPQRDRIRQLLLEQLEQLAEDRLRDKRYGEALEFALAAMRAAPLRETPHLLLVRVHMEEGNHCEALAAYLAYRSLLGAEPSPRMRQRVDSIATLSTRTVGQLLASG
ncbi:AfsR/SARP family transcriptional regulator [Kutzneria sp. CA-103260]|uniref:AfsR/SARP family transcriptional regulator n=1 Tax=Kutzneria sp. CA-103260 TaxID=2802641 RepID=UPI001BA818E0|nr:BTAD domain-containing putative transcriptional regulator [Kutzneria sp. CA-103260]QUQ63869.1 transcriptional regulator [Kutzneria sp. CA-103260]